MFSKFKGTLLTSVSSDFQRAKGKDVGNAKAGTTGCIRYPSPYPSPRFRRGVGQVRRMYHRYVAERIKGECFPQLGGEGLIHSLGGWSSIRTLCRPGHEVLTGERILEANDLAEKRPEEADRKPKRLPSLRLRDSGAFREFNLSHLSGLIRRSKTLLS